MRRSGRDHGSNLFDRKHRLLGWNGFLPRGQSQITEGPNFVDDRLNRADIREDRDGVPLQFVINLVRIHNGGCIALVGAMVDVWHCNQGGNKLILALTSGGDGYNGTFDVGLTV